MILKIDDAITFLREDPDTVDRNDLLNKIAAIEKSVERGSGYVAPLDGSPADPQAIELVKMMLAQLWDDPSGSISTVLSNYRITSFMQQIKMSVGDGGLL